VVLSYRIAINGYGRIGQALLRAMYTRPGRQNLKVVAINELADLETLVYLTRYDTTHGRFPVAVEAEGDRLIIDKDPIRILSQADPDRLPWKDLGIDLVLECTGSFTDRATATKHLKSGARRLLFSQPAADDVDATVVFGYNHQSLRHDHRIVSSASCTTNSVVPVLALLDRHLGIKNGVTTTIHSAMNDQPVIDRYHHRNLRLSRSAMQSLVPVETALHQGIIKFLPQLHGKIESLHLRVPTINVSLMDLSINLHQPTTVSAVNAIFQQAADGDLQGLLGYTEEPHASVDFNTDPRSAIVDGTQTRVSDGTLLKLMVWFDNEWSYACRMLDVASYWLECRS
jgi:D-erythrose 4-phosphate dehydrogenase